MDIKEKLIEITVSAKEILANEGVTAKQKAEAKQLLFRVLQLTEGHIKYGICFSCGRKIERKVLRNKPLAIKCLACSPETNRQLTNDRRKR